MLKVDVTLIHKNVEPMHAATHVCFFHNMILRVNNIWWGKRAHEYSFDLADRSTELERWFYQVFNRELCLVSMVKVYCSITLVFAMIVKTDYTCNVYKLNIAKIHMVTMTTVVKTQVVKEHMCFVQCGVLSVPNMKYSYEVIKY